MKIYIWNKCWNACWHLFLTCVCCCVEQNPCLLFGATNQSGRFPPQSPSTFWSKSRNIAHRSESISEPTATAAATAEKNMKSHINFPSLTANVRQQRAQQCSTVYVRVCVCVCSLIKWVVESGAQQASCKYIDWQPGGRGEQESHGRGRERERERRRRLLNVDLDIDWVPSLAVWASVRCVCVCVWLCEWVNDFANGHAKKM